MKKAFVAFAAVAAFCSGTAYAAQDNFNRRVEIQNRSDQSIHYVYASPVTSETWEEDLLGSNTIPPGRNVTANINNGTTECNYDIKIVMADSREHVRPRVNVCEVSQIIVLNDGISER